MSHGVWLARVHGVDNRRALCLPSPIPAGSCSVLCRLNQEGSFGIGIDEVEATLGAAAKSLGSFAESVWYLQPLHETIAKVSWGSCGVNERQRMFPRDSMTQARTRLAIDKQTTNSDLLMVAESFYTEGPGVLEQRARRDDCFSL